MNYPVPATVPYDFQTVGLFFSAIRLVLGVAIIFAWREVAKSLLLKYLPPLFRFIGRIGLSLPRKHFINASEYKSVPSHLPDETIPPIGQLPRMIRRGRSDSVGPQSAADAYETLAFRERKRRESLGKSDPTPNLADIQAGVVSQSNDFVSSPTSYEQKPIRKENNTNKNDEGDSNVSNPEEPYDMQEREMLSRIEKPRVRYDVEVVTKLLVYSGIAWWSVEGIPIVFSLVGLGAGSPAAAR